MIFPEAFSGEGSNVVVAGDVGPVLGEDAPTEGVDLTEGNGSHPGSFESEAEAANSAEEVEHIHD